MKYDSQDGSRGIVFGGFEADTISIQSNTSTDVGVDINIYPTGIRKPLEMI